MLLWQHKALLSLDVVIYCLQSHVRAQQTPDHLFDMRIHGGT